MAICSFCGTTLPPGTGLCYIKKDAKVLWFCSRKCEKNMLILGRKPRHQPWTEEAKAAKTAAKAAAAKGEQVHEPKEKKQKKAAPAEAKAARGAKAAPDAPNTDEDGDDA